MRIRTIKPEFFLHDGIFDAEREEKMPLRVAFIGLWCAADREGRFRWEPRRLGACILPYDLLDFSRVLHALTTRGFIEHHACPTGDFGVIPSFTRHQVINNRESPSILPIPTLESIIEPVLTRAPRVDDACPTVKSGREGKGREGNMEGKGIISPSKPDETVVAEIYAAYPRKVGKEEALKAIRRALATTASETLLEAVLAYASAIATWPEADRQYIPHPSTWFNRGGWEDDRSTWTKHQPKQKKGVQFDGFGKLDYEAGLEGFPRG